MPCVEESSLGYSSCSMNEPVKRFRATWLQGKRNRFHSHSLVAPGRTFVTTPQSENSKHISTRSSRRSFSPDQSKLGESQFESGFSLFENHLAAGSDLPPLIRCLQDHLDALSRAGALRRGVHESHSDSATSKRSLKSLPESQQQAHVSAEDDVLSSSVKEEEVEVVVPHAPSNVNRAFVDNTPLSPSSSFSSHNPVVVSRASRAVASALLFSVESDAAQREATQLFLSPAVCDIRANAVASVGARLHNGSISPRLPQTILKQDISSNVDRKPSMHSFRDAPSTVVPSLLCDRVTATLARRQLQSGNSTDALEMLRYAPHSNATAAVDIELHARELHWERAWSALLQQEPSVWQEPNISAVIRVLYHASHKRRNAGGGHEAVASGHSETALQNDKNSGGIFASSSTLGIANRDYDDDGELWERALQVFQTAVSTHRTDTYDFVRVRGNGDPMHVPCNVWQSISPVNDLLGILGVYNQWRAACALIDTYLAPISDGGSERVRIQSTREADAERADGVLINSEELDFYDFIENTSKSTRSDSGESASTATIRPHAHSFPESAKSALFSLAAEGKVRNRFPPANVVTVSMVCRALRDQWMVALKYVALLSSRDGVAIEGDAETTCQVLRAYTKGNRWMEAAGVLQKWYNSSRVISNTSTSKTFHTPKMMRHGKNNDIKSELRPEVCLELLYQFQKARRPELTSHVLQQHLLSKHHNPDVVSRAHNSMLQYAESLPECKHWMRLIEQKKLSLENESLAHLVEVHARAGEWERSLSYLNELLNDNQRRYYHIPTAKAHDTVQYALLCAATGDDGSGSGDENENPSSRRASSSSSKPGPSWEVAISLFSQMCERNVPVSQVAFQSAVKLCFSQGAGHQAQKLFSLMVKLGVHR